MKNYYVLYTVYNIIVQVVHILVNKMSNFFVALDICSVTFVTNCKA